MQLLLLMDYSQAFKRTLFEFGITGAELSRMSGVSPQQISAFRNGKQGVSTDTLQKLLEALDPKARAYFYQLVQMPSDRLPQAAENGGKYSA
jgi:transcriptional regulator with XRE-family HTH domain